jgi:hypothetical protein
MLGPVLSDTLESGLVETLESGLSGTLGWKLE